MEESLLHSERKQEYKSKYHFPALISTLLTSKAKDSLSTLSKPLCARTSLPHSLKSPTPSPLLRNKTRTFAFHRSLMRSTNGCSFSIRSAALGRYSPYRAAGASTRRDERACKLPLVSVCERERGRQTRGRGFSFYSELLRISHSTPVPG